MKGKLENKEKLIIYSGIPTLLAYITSKIEELKSLRTKQTIEKIRNIQSIAIHLFNEILQNKTVNLDSELIDADKLYEEYKILITKEINDLHSQYKYLKQEEEELNLFIDSISDGPSEYIYCKYIAPEMGGSGILACLSRSAAFSSCFINLDKMRKDALSHYPSRVYLQKDFKDKEILILKTKMSAKKQEVEEIRNKFNSYHEYLYNKYMDDSIIQKSQSIITKNELLAENFLDILLDINEYIYGDALKLQNEVEYIKPWIADVDNFSNMTIKLLEGLEGYY